jgi:ABC-type Fe3+-hydroxamate transport system substrate-binding protein
MNRKFKDQMGAEIHLHERPLRIISLVPSQTELLSYWGLEDRIVGITKFCIHPKNCFETKAKVGGTKKVNFEAIKALNPDLIIGNKEENAKSDIEYLQKHYPVWMSDINSLEDCYVMMQKLGELLECSDKAAEMILSMKGSFSNLKAEKSAAEAPRVAYFIWQEPYMVAASDTFIDEMLKVAGFRNVFESFSRYPEIDMELLVKLNPDLIFLSSEPYPFKEKHLAFFKQICPRAELTIVDGELFSWYGSRLLKSADYFMELQLKFSKI